MYFEQKNNNSYWKTKFDNFEIITDWERYKNPDKPKLKLNEYRLIKIDYKLYLEVKTQKENITFFTDFKHFKHIQNHTWTAHKYRNTFYIDSKIKRKTLLFHRFIKSEWKSIDHINRQTFDNRECNLRSGENGINNRNCKMKKNNISGFNGVYYHKNKAWCVCWYENKKYNQKYFKGVRDDDQVKQHAIAFRREIDQRLGIRNGYDV